MGAALQKIALQAERAGEFIRSLKRFVRKARPLRARSDLNTVVREALTFAAPDLHARQIAVRCDLAPDLPAVVMDVIQIEQVILNLVRNALDALDAVPPDQREPAHCHARQSRGRHVDRVRQRWRRTAR